MCEGRKIIIYEVESRFICLFFPPLRCPSGKSAIVLFRIFFDFWAARGAGRIFSHFELRLRPLGPKEKYPKVIKKSFVRHNEGYRYLGDEERHERMRYKLMENCSLKTKSSAKLRHCTLWLFAAGKCMNSFFRGGDLIGVRTDPPASKLRVRRPDGRVSVASDQEPVPPQKETPLPPLRERRGPDSNQTRRQTNSCIFV